MRIFIMAAIITFICFPAAAEVPNLMPGYLSDLQRVTFKSIATPANQVLVPRDLDFDPSGNLWIVNKGTTSTGSPTVRVFNPGMPTARFRYQIDANARHFFNSATAIAFGDNGNFASSPGILDANNTSRTTGGAGFTGPSLWNSDTNIYAKPSGGNGSHIDMLHESPYSMGIAHDRDNVYWVFCAFWKDIVRYDFKVPHAPGGSNHKDGSVRRYPEVAPKWINKDLPCHLVLQKSKGWLYIVDAGNRRIIRMNTSVGTPNGTPSMPAQEGVAEYVKMAGAKWEVVAEEGLVEPVGIDIVENHMVVSEHSTGEIIIFDIARMPAQELGRISTGSKGIMGVTIGPNGKIYFVNAINSTAMVAEPRVVSTSLPPSVLPGAAWIDLRHQPNSGKIAAHAVGFDLGSLRFLVTDANGRVMARENRPGSGRFSLPSSAYMNGRYFLNMSDGRTSVTRAVELGN